MKETCKTCIHYWVCAERIDPDKCAFRNVVADEKSATAYIMSKEKKHD